MQILKKIPGVPSLTKKIEVPITFSPLKIFDFFLHRCLWVNELFRLVSLKVGLRPSKGVKLAFKSFPLHMVARMWAESRLG